MKRDHLTLPAGAHLPGEQRQTRLTRGWRTGALAALLAVTVGTHGASDPLWVIVKTKRGAKGGLLNAMLAKAGG